MAGKRDLGADAPADLSPGARRFAATILGDMTLPERYELRRRIARGGMASVWCALDRALDRQVAIKLLSEPFAHDETAVRRFQREARTAARLSAHPHVVTIYDVGQATAADGSPGRPFIVMEHLTGGTIADALRLGAVPPEDAARWLLEAAAALDYAHGKGVIHRDVKLANFLLDGARTLHVGDFGIAQLGTEDTLTGTGQLIGTAAYLAPERALGRPATEASDRYALATCAFELLVGERPFAAENFAGVARQHIEDTPPDASARNPSLPRSLDAVLSRGLAKRPGDRWPTATAMAEAIKDALRVQGPQLSSPPTRISRALSGRARVRELPSRHTRSAPTRPAPPAPTHAGRQGSRSGRRAAAVLALLIVAVGVGIAAAGSDSAPAGRVRSAAGLRASAAPSQSHHRVQSTSAAAAHAPVKPKPATTKAHSKQTAPAPPSADALEAQGHQLMAGGNYTAAIAVLRQAVAAADPESLTYAYALFDLGHSLRLAGDPRAAVPILWRRLQIPNQTAVVRQELTLALQALGQQVAGGGAAPQPPGHHRASGAGAGAQHD